MKHAIRIIEGIGPKGKGQDARMLGEFLKMTGWRPDVRKVYKKGNNRKKFLKYFLDSNCRFLHISAHGDGKSISLEDPDRTKISVNDLKRYCKKNPQYEVLNKKFITMSTCGHVSMQFVTELHQITRVTAVISPLAPIGFSESALFASLFYFSLHNAAESADENIDAAERVAQYIDAYQRAKVAYIAVGGTGAHRLDYWWKNERVIVH